MRSSLFSLIACASCVPHRALPTDVPPPGATSDFGPTPPDGAGFPIDNPSPRPTCGVPLDHTDCACTPGEYVACYPGDPATIGVGSCRRGVQGCTGAGEFIAFGPCVGAVVPSPEAIHCTDGIDNDCNGLTDCNDPACFNDPACLPARANGCAPNLPADSDGRCRAGYYSDGNGCCAHCTAMDCNFPECCLIAACTQAPHCGMCVGGRPALDPACHGRVDADCDDFPEDCDQLCCPCRPVGACTACPPGQVDCGGGCVDVTSDPARCGSCDRPCAPGQQCTSARCA
jgi:hypothetical protein